jgi:uncharacterized NAD-dependent epimerase/dehydratase family protein
MCRAGSRTIENVGMMQYQIPRPYLLFLGEETSPPHAKTAFGLRDWAPELCVGEFALRGATVSTGLPILSPTLAHARGARSLVIGVAPIGGSIPISWAAVLNDALEAGLDVVSGMHTRLDDIPGLAATAERLGRHLINVRQPPADLPIATGRRRTGKRLLTVGTDCALGKKYTALSLTRGFRSRNIAVDFRATGQTGILIAGGGIPIDAVVSDFAAGAAELLSPDAADDHWDIVEGQGSIFHPAYAGVSLALLHGTQPDVIVMCHEVGRDNILGFPNYPTPSLREAIELTITLARRTNPAVRCAGVSLNTSALVDSAAQSVLAESAKTLGLPVADPIRGGPAFEHLLNECMSAR